MLKMKNDRNIPTKKKKIFFFKLKKKHARFRRLKELNCRGVREFEGQNKYLEVLVVSKSHQLVW